MRSVSIGDVVACRGRVTLVQRLWRDREWQVATFERGARFVVDGIGRDMLVSPMRGPWWLMIVFLFCSFKVNSADFFAAFEGKP